MQIGREYSQAILSSSNRFGHHAQSLIVIIKVNIRTKPVFKNLLDASATRFRDMDSN